VTRLLNLVKDVGQVAATTVLAVVHGGHEDTGTALTMLLVFWMRRCSEKEETYGVRGALATQALDLAVTVNLVVLEDGELVLLALVLDLLGGGVDLLLALLTTTTEAEDEVKSALLLDVVVGEGAAILKLLASKDQALLVRGDTLLVCVESVSFAAAAGLKWRWAPAEEGAHPGSWT
jgi:hypothetical protein